MDSSATFLDKLWTAPEILRMVDPPLQGTQKSDVYSFSIVIQEVLLRDRPFCRETMNPEGARRVNTQTML